MSPLVVAAVAWIAAGVGVLWGWALRSMFLDVDRAAAEDCRRARVYYLMQQAGMYSPSQVRKEYKQ